MQPLFGVSFANDCDREKSNESSDMLFSRHHEAENVVHQLEKHG